MSMRISSPEKERTVYRVLTTLENL